MTFSKEEIDKYIILQDEFYKKTYEIFQLTISDDGTNPDFDGFEIHDGDSTIFFQDFEGDICEFIFPTKWLNMEPDAISKEYADIKKKEEEESENYWEN